MGFKYVCFNELTLEPLCTTGSMAYERVKSFGETLKRAHETLGTKVVRYDDALQNIPLSKEISLNKFCSARKNDKSLDGIQLILSSSTMPLVDIEDKEIASVYDGTDVSLTIAGGKRRSRGLAAAYVHNEPSIGFNSEEFWNDVMHTMQVTSNNHTKNTNWPCLTLPEHLNHDEFNTWIQDHSEITLIETSLSIEEKKIKLSDDHGRDVLLQHAKALCSSGYVEGVVCSLPYQPTCVQYIYKTTPEGLVDIVLFWSDKGFSMRVKTTGRNSRETDAIANKLKEKYSK